MNIELNEAAADLVRNTAITLRTRYLVDFTPEQIVNALLLANGTEGAIAVFGELFSGPTPDEDNQFPLIGLDEHSHPAGAELAAG